VATAAIKCMSPQVRQQLLAHAHCCCRHSSDSACSLRCCCLKSLLIARLPAFIWARVFCFL
jgi:hypothetical protein